MAIEFRRLRRLLTTLGTLFGAAMLVGSLLLLARTTHDSGQFGQLQLIILAINATGVGVLTLLILFALGRLAREYARREVGARLKVRMVSIFAVLALLPLVVVFLFSLQFINRGIESWFDDDVGDGLGEALGLARLALEARKDEFREITLNIGTALARRDEVVLYGLLEQQRARYGARELTLYDPSGRILALSAGLPAAADPTVSIGGVPLPPLRPDEPYVVVDPLPEGGLSVRTAVLVDAPGTGESRILVALFPLPERFAELAQTIEGAYTAYARSAYLREPLKFSFTLTLSLVLLLSALSAVWGAIFAARRVVAPIQDLVAGTRAVAKGDFSRKLPIPTRDDIGFLVSSFNDMTDRLAQARESAVRSQQEVERERLKLSTILASLSTGVIALEADMRVRTANRAAESILGVELPAGRVLTPDGASSDALLQVLEMYGTQLAGGHRVWRGEIPIRDDRGPRVLMCACAALPGDEDGGDGAPGSVLVIEEITGLLRAQRDAAWGEVARRLAHEIKNPLTPIKLSAERLRRRYLDKLPPQEATVLDRATHTIVQQVDAMRGMVDAFRDYARSPALALDDVDLNRIVAEVVELYRGRETPARLEVHADATASMIEADGDRLRQILHNLLTNALEALAGRADGRISVLTSSYEDEGHAFVELRIEDNGPGFNLPSAAHVFEPYVTTKSKGTGLGLAIVRKIVEEHGGMIEVGNRIGAQGAWVRISLPRDAHARAFAAARLAGRNGDTRSVAGARAAGAPRTEGSGDGPMTTGKSPSPAGSRSSREEVD